MSGSAELFLQHCQVPFLLWKENFQEVIDELATTIREVPPDQCAKLLNLVYKHLQLDKSNDTPRTLTDASHTWMLPRGDIQLNPYVPPPNEQRVPLPTPNIIQWITDALPIMNAPNPTQKRCLKLTPWTHSRRTRNNIPGSVPRITPVAP